MRRKKQYHSCQLSMAVHCFCTLKLHRWSESKDGTRLSSLHGCMQVLTLLYGVYDNSPILSHTLHHLACNQDLQRTAQAELDAFWGWQPPSTIEQLTNLRFVTACLKVAAPCSGLLLPVRHICRRPCSLQAARMQTLHACVSQYAGLRSAAHTLKDLQPMLGMCRKDAVQ